MHFADYSFYTDRYGGEMSEEEFRRYGQRASVYVDYMTCRRAAEHSQSEAVQLAVCAVADVLKEHYTRAVVAEANDGLSVRYAAEVQEDRSKAMYEALCLYLSGSGLLYRGVIGDDRL